jgi:hypothetical protein
MASWGRRAPHSIHKRDDQKKNAMRASRTANDGTHEYATKGMPRSVPCSHFHTRAIVLGRPQEGGRRCDKSKAKNADRASGTAHSGAPAFSWKPKTTESASERFSAYSPRQASESEYLLVVRAVKWEHPRTVLKSYLHIYKKGDCLTKGCAVGGGQIQKARQTLFFESDTMPRCLEYICSEMACDSSLYLNCLQLLIVIDPN